MDSWKDTKEFIALNGQFKHAEHSPTLTSWLLVWECDKDARVIDLMMSYCANNDLIPTSQMVKAVGELAALRLNGELKEYKDSRVYLEVKEAVFKNMFHMIDYCHLGQDKASINGAKILKFKSISDSRIKLIQPNSLKAQYRDWRAKHESYLNKILEVTPHWGVKEIEEYLKQYEVVELSDLEVGQLR
ncbi:protein of unknown function [Shewanella benthica]|uniref:Uncharacterized protein n=1 Tax=Shewanella benthica TaxID=43661 RepID=A0A330LZU9_9GAMM|nr:hypothetical protein [Shewanella benthica]SQH75522.1 protein of unknown function [Shewanella benthica]